MVLFVSACISIAIIVTVVIPSFKEIFDQAGLKLPLATKIVMTIGDIAAAWWWLPIVVGCLGVLVYARQRRTRRRGASLMGNCFGYRWLDR